MMKKIRNLLFFGELSKENYDKVKNKAREENRKSLNVFCIIGIITFIIVTIFAIALLKNKILMHSYLVFIACFILIWLINFFFSKKYPVTADILAIIFSFILLCGGICISFVQQNDRATLLLPFFVFATILFSTPVIYFLVGTFVAETAYIVLATFIFKPENIYVYQMNIIETLAFSIIGLVIGSYLTFVKYKKYNAEVKNEYLSSYDVMTGLLNRRSFEEEITNIKKSKKPVLVYTFDINGLKQTNDTKGHMAGDELIKTSAKCIETVFSPHGKVFRTGGDEFVAIIDLDSPEDSLLQARLNDETNNKVTLSVGHAKIVSDFDKNISRVLREADTTMYEQKREYHKMHQEE